MDIARGNKSHRSNKSHCVRATAHREHSVPLHLPSRGMLRLGEDVLAAGELDVAWGAASLVYWGACSDVHDYYAQIGDDEEAVRLHHTWRGHQQGWGAQGGGRGSTRERLEETCTARRSVSDRISRRGG